MKGILRVSVNRGRSSGRSGGINDAMQSRWWELLSLLVIRGSLLSLGDALHRVAVALRLIVLGEAIATFLSLISALYLLKQGYDSMFKSALGMLCPRQILLIQTHLALYSQLLTRFQSSSVTV